MLAYRFDVPNGTYQVTLKFAELFWLSRGQRVFDVYIENSTMLPNFDIIAAAGDRLRAIDRTFAVQVSDGRLDIDFVARVNFPQVSAIEVAPLGPAVTAAPTVTVVPPTATPTETLVPIETPTVTVVPPTATPTEALVPIETPTMTVVPPTTTPTETLVPIETPTVTVVPPTTTSTETLMPAETPTPISMPTAVPTPTVGATGIHEAQATFLDLTSFGDIVLRGVNPSATLYLPLPEEWRIQSGRLILLLSHSHVLRPDSTLTLKLNGVPVSSVSLTESNAEKAKWTVDVPANALTGDTLVVSFSGYLRTSDDPCHDLDEVANWAKISSDSILWLEYARQSPELDLGHFAYPFIRAHSWTRDAAVFVLPEEANGTEMTAAYSIATRLGQQATWRSLDLYVVTPSQLTDEMKGTYSFVLIGRPTRMPVLQQVTLPIHTDAGDNIRDAAGLTLPADSGVLAVASSPWNPERAVLAVTGNSDSGMVKAAQSLSLPSLPAVVRGPVAFISESPKFTAETTTALDWSAVSLSALGYTEHIANGLGPQRILFGFDLPLRTVQSGQLTVYFSHAPFVSTDRSYLNVIVNTIPVRGVYLDADNETRGTLVVNLPTNQLKPGVRNTIEFLFEFHLTRHEDCTSPALEQAWGIIHADSALSLSFASEPGIPARLDHFPAPFDSGAIVAISAQPGPEERAAAFRLAGQLGQWLGERAANIRFIPADQVSPPERDSHHLILIGRAESNPLIAQVQSKLPLQIAGNKVIRTAQGSVSLRDTGRSGVIQTIVHPWNPQRVVLVISGTDDASIGYAMHILTDASLKARLRGDVALVDERGFLTTLDSQATPTPVPGQPKGPQPIPTIVPYVPIGLVILGLLILAIVLLRRGRASSRAGR
jgi:hypothetical protein